jgi:hypothetical protein
MSMSSVAIDDQRKNRANEAEKSESARGWIAVLLSVLLVCSTTALFAAGQGYRLGYFYELGFDLAQLPSNFHETLFWGFSGGMPLALRWLVAAVIAALACGLLIWLADVLWKHATDRWRQLRRIAIPSAKPARKVDTHVKLIAVAFLLLPLTYLLAVVYIGMAEFQKLGSKKGKEFIEALRTNPAAASRKYGIQKIEIWFNSPADTVVRGYRLLCTETICSIYDPDPKVRIVRLVSLENLREIRVVDRGGP